MAAMAAARPPARAACRWHACDEALAPPPLYSSISVLQPTTCRSAACVCVRIAATTASSAPASAARESPAACEASRTPTSAPQPSTCTSAVRGCARIASSTASSAPASAARCDRARPPASEPKQVLRRMRQPFTWTVASRACACITATTASIAPASAAACSLPGGSLSASSRLSASSATRATARCARSAATTSASPISSTSASLGGGPLAIASKSWPPVAAATSSASPRYREPRRPRPPSAVTRRCSRSFSALSCSHSDLKGSTMRRQTANGQAFSCAARSDAHPSH
mmetsp:Transcript_37943/g.96356  ORF Transcript_37943/g.96356 Transcript_37943/m.96356 type:complete len:287 (+) Transcript_37943:466-1326(+)